MSEKLEQKVFWSDESKPDKKYTTTTWYRCVGIGPFIQRVLEKHNIVGVTFEDDNIFGFILEEKK